MSVPFALSSAVAYGAGDFVGGLAARRAPVLTVTAVAQAAGLAVLLPAVLLVPGEVSASALVLGALAGTAGMLGLLLYLRGLSVGPMGLVAPLSSVVGAGLPLLAGVLGGERPGPVAPRRLVAFVPFASVILREIAVGAWRVSAFVLQPRSRARPGVVAVPLGDRTRLGVAVSALAIGLSPGSAVLEIDWRRRAMLVHVLDARDPDEVRAQLDSFYDRYQRHVFP